MYEGGKFKVATDSKRLIEQEAGVPDDRINLDWAISTLNSVMVSLSHRELGPAIENMNSFYSEMMKHDESEISHVMEWVMTDPRLKSFVDFIQTSLVEPCDNLDFILACVRIVHLFSLMQKDLASQFCDLFTLNGILSVLEDPLAECSVVQDYQPENRPLSHDEYCTVTKYILSALHNFTDSLELSEEVIDCIMSVVVRVFPKLQRSEAMKFWIFTVARMLQRYYDSIDPELLRYCWDYGYTIIHQGMTVPSESFLIPETFLLQDPDFVSRVLSVPQLCVIIDQNLSCASARHSSLCLSFIAIMVKADPDAMLELIERRSSWILEVISADSAPVEVLSSFAKLCRIVADTNDQNYVDLMSKCGFISFLTHLCHHPVFAVSNAAVEALIVGFPLFTDTVIQSIISSDFLSPFAAHLESIDERTTSIAVVDRLFECETRGTINKDELHAAITSSSLLTSLEALSPAPSIPESWLALK